MRQKVVYLLFLGHFLSSATNPSSKSQCYQHYFPILQMKVLLFYLKGSYERLMVVGGWPFSEYEVEVIDLSGNHQHCRHLQNGICGYLRTYLALFLPALPAHVNNCCCCCSCLCEVNLPLVLWCFSAMGVLIVVFVVGLKIEIQCSSLKRPAFVQPCFGR